MFLAGALASAPSPAAVRAPTVPVVASYSNMAWFLVGFELGPWEEYLIHELTPDLERLGTEPAPEISWLAM
mgnify:CR=1 FL=1